MNFGMFELQVGGPKPLVEHRLEGACLLGDAGHHYAGIVGVHPNRDIWDFSPYAAEQAVYAGDKEQGG